MISYVLGATTSGPMIMCRWDVDVAGELLATGKHEQDEIDLVLRTARRMFGDAPINAVDGGANVGTWTVQMAKALGGEVHAFEPQRWLYYALAGNVALNNCLNAFPQLAALTDGLGPVDVPQLPIQAPVNLSTLRLDQSNDRPHHRVPGVTIDSLRRPFKLLKLDIEGMEVRALHGAAHTIAVHRPLVFAEVHLVMTGSLAGMLPDYSETLISHDRRNALYIPREYHIDL